MAKVTKTPAGGPDATGHPGVNAPIPANDQTSGGVTPPPDGYVPPEASPLFHDLRTGPPLHAAIPARAAPSLSPPMARDHGLQTFFVLPSRPHLVVPDNEIASQRMEAGLAYMTRLLRERYPAEPAYATPLSREQIESLTHDTSLLEVLGEELSDVDPNVAFYAGSFDPVTNGHLEILRQARDVFGKIYVGVATNPEKKYTYPAAVRKTLLEESLRSVGITNVEVIDYPTSIPTVQMAARLGAGTIIRGARNETDLTVELAVAWTNQVIDPRLQTVLFTPHDFTDVSSSGLKRALERGEDISQMAPGPVYYELVRDSWKRMDERPRLVGLVGGIGSGKSTVLEELRQDAGIVTIDFDRVWHDLMLRPDVVRELVDAFGEGILEDGKVDRVKLRDNVFGDSTANRFTFNRIARTRVMRRVHELIHAIAAEKREVHTIVFEGYGIVESGMHRLLDEVWYIEAPEAQRIERALADPKREKQSRKHLEAVIRTQAETLELSRRRANRLIDNSRDEAHLMSQIERIRRDLDLLSRLYPDVPEWVRRVAGPLERIDPIAHHGDEWRDRIAIVHGEKKITYGELDDHADRIALFLDDVNKEPLLGGPFIGMTGVYFLGDNRPENLEIALGAKRAGTPYTPFSKYLDPETLIRSLVSKKYRVLFVDRAGLKAISDHFGHLLLTDTLVVCVDEGNYRGVVPYHRLLDAVERPSIPLSSRDDRDDLEAVLFTSGTTGIPKRIERTTSSLRVHPRLGIGEDDRYLVTASLFHGGYLRWSNAHLFAGGRVYLAPTRNIEEYLRLIREERITSLLLPPVVLRRMLALCEGRSTPCDFSSLRRVNVIGAPFPEDLKEKAVKFFGPGRVWETYATTEYGVITVLPPDEILDHPTTAGKAVEGVKIEIRADDRSQLPAGSTGHIYVNTPFTGGEFVQTDDDGSLDEEGYLTIAGRQSDLILSRGINFYAGEIENALLQIPQVEDVCVLGIPHPEHGEEIVAVVVLKNGLTVTEDWIRERARDLLYDRRATPKRVFFFPELPRSSAGKVKVAELKTMVLGKLESTGEDAPEPVIPGLHVSLSAELPEEVPSVLGRLYAKGHLSREQLALWSHAMSHLREMRIPFSSVLVGAILTLTQKVEIELFVSRLIDGKRPREALSETIQQLRTPPSANETVDPDKALLAVATELGWSVPEKGKYRTLEAAYRHLFLAPDGRLFAVDFLYGYKGEYDILVVTQLLNDDTDVRRLSTDQAIPFLGRFAHSHPDIREVEYSHASAGQPLGVPPRDYGALAPDAYPRWDAHWDFFGEPGLSSECKTLAEITPVNLADGTQGLVVQEIIYDDSHAVPRLKLLNAASGEQLFEAPESEWEETTPANQLPKKGAGSGGNPVPASPAPGNPETSATPVPSPRLSKRRSTAGKRAGEEKPATETGPTMRGGGSLVSGRRFFAGDRPTETASLLDGTAALAVAPVVSLRATGGSEAIQLETSSETTGLPRPFGARNDPSTILRQAQDGGSGQALRIALIRYATQKGLQKVSAFLARLNEAQVRRLGGALGSHPHGSTGSPCPKRADRLLATIAKRIGADEELARIVPSATTNLPAGLPVGLSGVTSTATMARSPIPVLR